MRHSASNVRHSRRKATSRKPLSHRGMNAYDAWDVDHLRYQEGDEMMIDLF